MRHRPIAVQFDQHSCNQVLRAHGVVAVDVLNDVLAVTRESGRSVDDADLTRTESCPTPGISQSRPTVNGLAPEVDDVKIGLFYNTGVYGVDPDNMIALARHAEACGFESFYVGEHIVLYPGAAVAGIQIPPALPIADPLECLTFVAAATQRIVLGTGVLLLPYHHPVVLAKRLATLDVLSRGRMRLLTVGIGSLAGGQRRSA